MRHATDETAIRNAIAGTAISIDAAVRGVRGMRVGSTRAGGIDLLGSPMAIANWHRADVEIGGRPVGLGLGVRLGVTGGMRPLPR